MPFSLLVRTDFSSDTAWEEVRDEATRQYEYGFAANLLPVSNPAFDGAGWQAAKAAEPPDHQKDDYAYSSVLFVADHVALSEPEHPILVVGFGPNSDQPAFRVIPSQLWSVENNLNISNMDWQEFFQATGAGGVFRGFG